MSSKSINTANVHSSSLAYLVAYCLAVMNTEQQGCTRRGLSRLSDQGVAAVLRGRGLHTIPILRMCYCRPTCLTSFYILMCDMNMTTIEMIHGTV